MVESADKTDSNLACNQLTQKLYNIQF
jgi:hypothetical protein